MSDEKWRLACHQIVETLREREEKRGRELLITLCLGVPLSLIAPAFLGTVLYLIWSSVAATIGWPHLWWILFFVLAAAIMIPLLLAHERNQFDNQPIIVRTDTRGQTILYIDKSEVDLQSFGAMGLNIAGDAPSDDKWFVRPFFIGPRMVARSLPQRRMLHTLATAADMLTGATILAELAKTEHGVAVSALPIDETARNGLIPTLAYLRQLGWVDIKADGTRVWFSPDQRAIIRGVLRAAGITEPTT